MTPEFRPEDYSPRQLVTGQENDRIAAVPGNELTSEEIGHHAYSSINHCINPGIGRLRLAVNHGDNAKAAVELASINTTGLLAVVASIRPVLLLGICRVLAGRTLRQEKVRGSIPLCSTVNRGILRFFMSSGFGCPQ